MNIAFCVWTPYAFSTLPGSADIYAVILNSGFVTPSTWDGDSFDQHGVVFWSAIPTNPDPPIGT